jgi:hypothetical protein
LDERHFLPTRVAHLVTAFPLENRSLLDLPTVAVKIITNSDIVGRADIYQPDFNKFYRAVPRVPNPDVGRIFDNGDISYILALAGWDSGHSASSLVSS